MNRLGWFCLGIALGCSATIYNETGSLRGFALGGVGLLIGFTAAIIVSIVRRGR